MQTCAQCRWCFIQIVNGNSVNQTETLSRVSVFTYPKQRCLLSLQKFWIGTDCAAECLAELDVSPKRSRHFRHCLSHWRISKDNRHRAEIISNPCLLCYSIPPKNPQIKITVSAQFLESAEIHKENEFVRLYWIVIYGIINWLFSALKLYKKLCGKQSGSEVK